MVRPRSADAIAQAHVEDPVDDGRIPVEARAEPIRTPCENSEFEKMKHELTHSHSNQGAHHASKKAQAEPKKRIERIVEHSQLPIVQCAYLVLKDVAASDGLTVSSMYVKSFGNGTSTVVETKGATDTFAMRW